MNGSYVAECTVAVLYITRETVVLECSLCVRICPADVLKRNMRWLDSRVKIVANKCIVVALTVLCL